MKDQLIIIFAKNIQEGKVKTRLARTIGDRGAVHVYTYLVGITEEQTKAVFEADRRVYFSDFMVDSIWPDDEKFVQEGNSLGARMKNAFEKGFNDGYKQIIGVGADLPDLSKEIILDAFEVLQENDCVFGPAEDGGYYLLGMNQLQPTIFENKPWSKENLFQSTTEELDQLSVSYGLTKKLNDIDTVEDLKASSLAQKFKKYYDLS